MRCILLCLGSLPVEIQLICFDQIRKTQLHASNGRTSTKLSFQNLKILKTISSGRDVMYTLNSLQRPWGLVLTFPVWVFIMTDDDCHILSAVYDISCLGVYYDRWWLSYPFRCLWHFLSGCLLWQMTIVISFPLVITFPVWGFIMTDDDCHILSACYNISCLRVYYYRWRSWYFFRYYDISSLWVYYNRWLLSYPFRLLWHFLSEGLLWHMMIVISFPRGRKTAPSDYCRWTKRHRVVQSLTNWILKYN